jgi:hypothetical protein
MPWVGIPGLGMPWVGGTPGKRWVCMPSSDMRCVGIPGLGRPLVGIPWVGMPWGGMPLVGRPLVGIPWVGMPWGGMLWVGRPWEEYGKRCVGTAPGEPSGRFPRTARARIRARLRSKDV